LQESIEDVKTIFSFKLNYDMACHLAQSSSQLKVTYDGLISKYRANSGRQKEGILNNEMQLGQDYGKIDDDMESNYSM